MPLDDGSSKILPLASISDGLSSTLAFSEKPIGSGATGSYDPFRDWVPYNLSGDDWGADNWLNACSHLARAYVAGGRARRRRILDDPRSGLHPFLCIGPPEFAGPGLRDEPHQ